MVKEKIVYFFHLCHSRVRATISPCRRGVDWNRIEVDSLEGARTPFSGATPENRTWFDGSFIIENTHITIIAFTASPFCKRPIGVPPHLVVNCCKLQVFGRFAHAESAVNGIFYLFQCFH